MKSIRFSLLFFTGISILIFCVLKADAQPNGILEKIATGFQFAEGPVWIDKDGGYLLFSDIDGNTIYKWSEISGTGTFLNPSGNANGLAIDVYGNLFMAQHGSRQIGKLESGNTVSTVVSTYNDKRLNSPNDLTVKSNGDIYFTDPSYGINPQQEELGFYGVFVFQPSTASLKLLIDDLPRPNGIAFSPDEWYLYVADSELKKIFRYELKIDGEIRKKTEFANIGAEIDGIKTNKDGHVFVAVSDSGIQEFDENGTFLNLIPVPEKTRNLVWGGKNRNTLFITAGKSVYRIKINPDYPFVLNELLSRPTQNEITLTMLAETDVELFVKYGKSSGNYLQQTTPSLFKKDETIRIVLKNLEPYSRYYYQVNFRLPEATDFNTRSEYTFHTPKTEGKTFNFAIQADPHLDESSNYETYKNAMSNTLALQPDFLIDLGDNFMSDKLPVKSYENIVKRMFLLRHFYEMTGHSVPLYLVNGNHEDETGWDFNGTDSNIPAWNTLARKLYYPNPQPNNFYSGDTIVSPIVGQRESYYSWQWGNALFVVLDPYWNTIEKPVKTGDGWDWTLGKTQYAWLKKTLETSNAKFKFVFCHQIVGGDNQGRGGTEMVKYFEMGGFNSDDSFGFNEHRPGWEKPVHQLFVENGVTIFFHGHDHFYDRQELDGVIYQLVPQPSLFNYTETNMAAEYGYTDGLILPNSGHLNVTVSENSATVDYIRAYHENMSSKNQVNGSVEYSYSVQKNTTGIEKPFTKKTKLKAFPNPGAGKITIEYQTEYGQNPTLDIFNINGEKRLSFQNLNSSVGYILIEKGQLQPGIYVARLITSSEMLTLKIVLN
jgi:sugar lactone lactonase YvrE